MTRCPLSLASPCGQCPALTPPLCYSENEALWREVASLRQKHAQQQKVVNKVCQSGQETPGRGPGRAPLTRPFLSTAHPVPHLAGAVQPHPGGEEKDVRPGAPLSTAQPGALSGRCLIRPGWGGI